MSLMMSMVRARVRVRVEVRAKVELGARVDISHSHSPLLFSLCPAYLSKRNQGLLLERSVLLQQLERQEALISDLQGEIDWMGLNIETAIMGADLRARKDVIAKMRGERALIEQWRANEIMKLSKFNTTQCIASSCALLFNTSTLTMTGVYNGTGYLRNTSAGTEAAVFSFDSVYLGPEVQIIVVGQRALVIMSRTSLVLNTTIQARAGTLGGFQGGGTAGLLRSEGFSDSPRLLSICDLNDYCRNKTR
jgi:hypothetical protein